MSNPNLIYFDLETQKSAAEVGGWHNALKMGLAIGVTYSTREGEYKIYTEDQAGQLIDQLQKADKIIGFNIIKFDYAVLTPYTVFDLSQIPTLDLMLDIESRIGHRIGLDAVAGATLGIGKTADGSTALKWWKQGKIKEIAEYCCYDVKTTMLVHQHGAEQGWVRYIHNRTKLPRDIPVEWK